MTDCKFNTNLECHLYEDPEAMCYYEDLEDCLCFTTGKYKSRKDVDKKGYCGVEFFDKHTHTHTIVKKIVSFFFKNGRIE